MAEQFFQHTFPNGLSLLCERMAGMHSATMNLWVTAGAASDQTNQLGTATVLSDLVLRGAGARDNKTLTDYLDTLGLQRGSSVGVHHTRFSSAGLADNVVEGFAAYSDIVRRPQMPESGFDAARDLALQALAGIDDEPRQKLMIALHEHFLPAPYNRNGMGKQEDLKKLSLEQCTADHARRYHARGAILSVAGNIDFKQIKGEVEKHFASWKGAESAAIELTPSTSNFRHEFQESEQTHIGVAYPSLPETHPDYYILRLAMEVLSGGMSGRLFTEVREKRGLVYNVWAGYTSLKGLGSILGYAGTSNERAQATLDCFIAELHRLSDGVSSPELDRAKTGLKANLIMQGESTPARSGAIAHDFFVRGRIRTLEEIKHAIDKVSLDQVNSFLRANPPGPFTIVTVGPRELKTPS